MNTKDVKIPKKPEISKEAADLLKRLLNVNSVRGLLVYAYTFSVTSRFVFCFFRCCFCSTVHSTKLFSFLFSQNKRLSNAAQIRRHPWFKGIHFALIRSQTPPLVPDIKAVRLSEDTSVSCKNC